MEAAGAWATEPLARKARVLPAVEVRPEELGWDAGMTGESEGEGGVECVEDFAAEAGGLGPDEAESDFEPWVPP